MSTIPHVAGHAHVGKDAAPASGKTPDKAGGTWSGLLAAAEAQRGGNGKATEAADNSPTNAALAKTDGKHKQKKDDAPSPLPVLATLPTTPPEQAGTKPDGKPPAGTTAIAKPEQADAQQPAAIAPDKTPPAQPAAQMLSTAQQAAPTHPDEPAPVPAATPTPTPVSDMTADISVNPAATQTTAPSAHVATPPATADTTPTVQPAALHEGTGQALASQPQQPAPQPGAQAATPQITPAIATVMPATHDSTPPIQAPAQTAPSPAPDTAPMSLAPAAMAATVTAMHQSGQSTATLRLDPPDLGSLSVHVALNQAGQVNVVFAPSTAQAAQALHAGLDSFRQAMNGSGLTLGQVEVSGGNAGNGGNAGQQQRQAPLHQPQPAASPTPPPDGVRAYA